MTEETIQPQEQAICPDVIAAQFLPFMAAEPLSTAAPGDAVLCLEEKQCLPILHRLPLAGRHGVRVLVCPPSIAAAHALARGVYGRLLFDDRWLRAVLVGEVHNLRESITALQTPKGATS